ALGNAQCDEEADPDGLAMAVDAIAGRRLDRVREGVTEVEARTLTAIPLVGGDDGELHSDAPPYELSQLRIVREQIVGSRCRACGIPQAPTSDQRRLDYLGEAGASLLRREGREQRGVGEDRARLVKCPDVVLRLGKVDPGLAAIGR